MKCLGPIGCCDLITTELVAAGYCSYYHHILTAVRGPVHAVPADLEAGGPGLDELVQVPVQPQPGAEVVDGLEMLQLQQPVLDGVTQDAVVPLSQHRHPVSDVEDG